MQRWMAIDDVKFSVIDAQECIVLPPEADPTTQSTTSTTTIATTSTTTSAPFLGRSTNTQNAIT